MKRLHGGQGLIGPISNFYRAFTTCPPYYVLSCSLFFPPVLKIKIISCLSATRFTHMMQLDTKLIKMTAIALVVAGLTGCNTWFQSGFGVTPINKIEKNWQRYSKVYVRGTVKQVVPFIGSAAYELEDSTGDIWVFTQKSTPPNQGEEILIQGRVKYQSIPISEQEFGEVYVEQIKRLELNE